MLDSIANALAGNPSKAQLRIIKKLRRTQSQIQNRQWWHLPLSMLEMRRGHLMASYGRLVLIDQAIPMAFAESMMPAGYISVGIAQRAAQRNVGFNRRLEHETRLASASRIQPIDDLVAQNA
ncbi:hypothetical protein [Microbacterium sp. MRS-1]|uniref:hypothetical protein n=1 Tax=Microbacterium sp. MRS-1 TaxID=1451261 RepID=UPI000450E443|nr:hypothetical protein [Microbacterium sp. MRS-1]EXJ50919.1 hypothetical protein AS96_12245 [Microbacterium sp. MRS-1]